MVASCQAWPPWASGVIPFAYAPSFAGVNLSRVVSSDFMVAGTPGGSDSDVAARGLQAWIVIDGTGAGQKSGLGVMTGCMLSTSLGIAPAFHVAMQGAYADLDGPLLIEDRPGGLRFEGSDVWPPGTDLWG